MFENQEQAQMPEQAVEAAQQPQLSINDLQNLRSIVDTAVRRGAFGANEMSAVGAAYDRVNAFLNAVSPQPDAASQTPAA